MQRLAINRFFRILSACLLFAITLSSCTAIKQAGLKKTNKTEKLANKPAKQPKFIKGIYLNGHIKGNATANAVDMRKVPQRPPTQKSNPAFVNAQQESNQPQATEIVLKKDKQPVASVENEQEPGTKYSNQVQTTVDDNSSKSIDMSSDYAMCAKYTDMVGIKCEEIANIQLYKFIDKWYGTNYRLGGQSEKGIDCSGFTQKLYGEVFNTELTRTAMEQYKNSEKIKQTDEAEEGDLVFFKQKGKRITHVGIYLANDYFIHSSTSSGVVISNLKEDYWHRHYVGVGKVNKGEKL